ncbi:MAG TPA: hypothetical protein VJN89_01070 [Candidatus Acidoferrum sp.]|nr:hypothetical protein [Candidatus Acidoferrum sp.]
MVATIGIGIVPIHTLWLPILLSAVIVFVASSILHMVLPYHRSDYKKLPDEDKVLAALRPMNLSRGLYVFPFCTHKDMKSPEMIEKYKAGPVGTMTIFQSGPPNMGTYLLKWFVYCLVIGVFTAYLTGRTVNAGTEYLRVFRVAGTVSFMAYGVGQLNDSIWKGQPWSNTIKHFIDGLIFALLTGGTFGWLWPK